MTRRAVRLSSAATIVAGLTAAGCGKAFYAQHPCERKDLTGCIIDRVRVVGAQQVSPNDIKSTIATVESSHSLGGVLEDVPILSLWDRVTVDYEVLDPHVLERDLARVERFYKARGYYDARARVARVRKADKARVAVEIVVEEGPPVVLTSAAIAWEDHAPSAVVPPAWKESAKGTEQKIQDALQETLAIGAPFAETPFEELKPRLVRILTDRGFAYAQVEAQAKVDRVGHRAEVTYRIEHGPPTTFGSLSIEGAWGMPHDVLTRVINIPEGTRFSTARLEKAQLALGDLRVFGSVDAIPKLSPQGVPRVTAVPIVIRVTPTALKTTKLGFGAEGGTRVGIHGVASWENRNFFGGLRQFTVEGKPGLIINPLTIVGPANDSPYTVVPEMRLHTVLTQPGFLDPGTRGIVSVDVNATQLQPGYTLGYLEFAGKAGAERSFWSERVRLGLFFNMQIDTPLTLELPGIQIAPSCGGYHTLLIPNAHSSFTLDLRRDAEGKRSALMPAHSGFYLASDLQFAWGSGSTDVRVRAEARGYLPVSKQVTLALRLTGGILHAFGGTLAQTEYLHPSEPYSGLLSDYTNDRSTQGCYVASEDYDPFSRKPKLLPPWDIPRSRWLQIMQLRGFYSGGTNSNRGYGYAGIGPQEPLPGISPKGPDGTSFLPIATGGTSLWEASVELRFPVYGKAGMTVFIDSSDVRHPNESLPYIPAPHVSAGIGLRYATPVGPLRADLALRIPGLQVIGAPAACRAYDPAHSPKADQLWWTGANTPSGDCYLLPNNGQAGSFLGIPLALSLAIGEAY